MPTVGHAAQRKKILPTVAKDSKKTYRQSALLQCRPVICGTSIAKNPTSKLYLKLKSYYKSALLQCRPVICGTSIAKNPTSKLYLKLKSYYKTQGVPYREMPNTGVLKGGQILFLEALLGRAADCIYSIDKQFGDERKVYI